MSVELAAAHGIFADLAWRADRAIGFRCSTRVFPASGSFAIYFEERLVSDAARGTGPARP